jgi:hypothetical protein
LLLQVVLPEVWLLLQHPVADHHCFPASCLASCQALTWQQSQEQLRRQQQPTSFPRRLSCHQRLKTAQLLTRRQKHTQSQLFLLPLLRLPLLLLPLAPRPRGCLLQDSALAAVA